MSTSVFCSHYEYMINKLDKTIYTPEYRALIAWLVSERKLAGLTIRDLGERLGVVHSYVGRIETFERRLDVFEYVRYCQALDLDPKHGIDIIISADD